MRDERVANCLCLFFQVRGMRKCDYGVVAGGVTFGELFAERV